MKFRSKLRGYVVFNVPIYLFRPLELPARLIMEVFTVQMLSPNMIIVKNNF